MSLQSWQDTDKENNRTIIGYAHKTSSNDSQEHRTMLLQRMMDCLVNLTLADCVFVSTSSFASNLLSERDKNYSKVTYLRDGQGNTLGNEKIKSGSSNDINKVYIRFPELHLKGTEVLFEHNWFCRFLNKCSRH